MIDQELVERNVETTTFKPKGKEKLMNHVYSEYSDKELENIYALLSGGSYNFDIQLNVGETIIGKVAGETPTHYLFDIGYKDYIHVEKRKGETDALYRYANGDDVISEQTEVEILITDISENPYMIKGSLSSLHRQNTYADILNDIDEPIEAYIIDSLPAGFTLELNYNGYKIPSFMPNILAGVNKLSFEQCQELVGKTLNVMIESYSPDKGTFIASRKKYLKSLIPQEIAKLKTVDENNYPIPYSGVVTGCAKFGIFIEFNEVLTSMIHVSNLSDMYKDTFSTIEAGTKINFFIKEINKDKIHLTQVWKETIWDTVEKGNEYEGTVKDEKSFGLLISLDSETIGLIHTTELEKIGTKPSIGDTVKVKVIFLQKDSRKIYLTLLK